MGGSAEDLMAGYPSYLSLDPAVLLAALADLRRFGVAVVAAAAGASMTLMWWAFASDDSSTSALAFVAGLLYGVPAAGVLVIWFRLRQRGKSRST